MTGEELKKVLIRDGYVLSSIAEKLGTSQQNFSQSLNAADVKTGLIEKLSKVLDVPVSYFYEQGAQAAAVAEGATLTAGAAAFGSNHQDHSSNGGSYNSPEIVAALIDQLAKKDAQIREKDDQIKSQSRQIDTLLATIATLTSPS